MRKDEREKKGHWIYLGQQDVLRIVSDTLFCICNFRFSAALVKQPRKQVQNDLKDIFIYLDMVKL